MSAGDSLLVRALLSCYPARWRDRYRDEYAVLISDLFATAAWHRHPALVVNTLRGALDARLHPIGALTMRSSSALSVAIWAAGLFTVAGIGFQKLTEDPAIMAAAGRHHAIGIAFATLVVASAIALLGVVALAVPTAIALIRTRERAAAKWIAVPPVAVAVWFGVLPVALALAHGHRVHSTATVLAAVLIFGGGIAVVAATAWAAATMLRRTPGIGPARLRPVSLSVLAGGMAVATIACAAWGASVLAAAPSWVPSRAGILATPFVPSWIAIVVAMAAATALAVLAAHRRPAEVHA